MESSGSETTVDGVVYPSADAWMESERTKVPPGFEIVSTPYWFDLRDNNKHRELTPCFRDKYLAAATAWRLWYEWYVPGAKQASDRLIAERTA